MHSQWDFRLSTSAQCGQSQADGATYFLSATTAPGIMHARCARLRARGVPSTGSPPPRACSPASIQRHPSGWCSRVRVALVSRRASRRRCAGGSLHGAPRVMCADCGEPLICVSRTARACRTYLGAKTHTTSPYIAPSHAVHVRRRERRRGGPGGARRAARRRAADGTRGARTGRRRKRATPDHTYTDADSNAHRAHRADGSPRHRATAQRRRRRA